MIGILSAVLPTIAGDIKLATMIPNGFAGGIRKSLLYLKHQNSSY